MINDEIRKYPYSMEIIDYGTGPNIFVLAFNDQEKRSWTDRFSNILVTENGKIIKAYGESFINNIEYINPPKLKNIFYELKENIKSNHYSLIKFSNPNTKFLSIKFQYSLLGNSSLTYIFNDKLIDVTLIEEKFFIEAINWSGSNFYWIDGYGEVYKSKQFIAPNMGKFYTETLKK
jgi:hypothetical protein